jgi:hypothetical protein
MILSAPVDEYAPARSEQPTLAAVFASSPPAADTLVTGVYRFLLTTQSVIALPVPVPSVPTRDGPDGAAAADRRSDAHAERPAGPVGQRARCAGAFVPALGSTPRASCRSTTRVSGDPSWVRRSCRS